METILKKEFDKVAFFTTEEITVKDVKHLISNHFNCSRDTTTLAKDFPLVDKDLYAVFCVKC